MERHFEKELAGLRGQLERMTDLCREGLAAAAKSFLEGDAAAAETAFRNEERINRMEIEIDHLVADCFALFQPVAVDLRFLLAILKINNALERMAYHVVTSPKSAVTCAAQKPTTRLEIPRMLELAHSMFTDGCRSF